MCKKDEERQIKTNTKNNKTIEIIDEF